MTIYLYVKTHNITGLKYLGKTTNKDPHRYPGSGKLWRRHLNVHGLDYSTVILKECNSEEEIKIAGEYYSALWNIVTDPGWANLRAETGDGGDTSKTPGYIKSKHKMIEHKTKCKWWNNGIRQSFSEYPPDTTYKKGRLRFNNTGSKIGSEINRHKIWINDGINECMSNKNNIPPGYSKGRLSVQRFKRTNSATGSKWWNNGVSEKMSTIAPDSSFTPGRLAR